MKIYKNLDLSENFQKIPILVKILQTLDLGPNFQKNLDFDQNYRNISIFVPIFENLDCRQSFR